MDMQIFDVVIKEESELPVSIFLDALQESLSANSGVTVGLCGDLGAGKTAFVRALAAKLSIVPECVTSPTYTLQQLYVVPQLGSAQQLKFIEHWDVYRLGAAPLELFERVAKGTLQLIEWADKFAHPVDYSLHFSILDTGQRRVTLTRR